LFKIKYLFVLVLGGFCAAGNAVAQTDAAAPGVMRIVVPFPPGGSNDVIARALAPPLAKRLGNSIIVDNRAGAAGVIGTDAVVKGPRDGTAVLLTSSTLLTTAATQSTVPYDPATALVAVSMIAQGPLLLAVTSAAPFKSTTDLLTAARRQPGVLNYGTAGVGSVAHLATELLNGRANIQMTHVPYKGAANALIDLAAGHIGVMISNYSSIVSQVKGGKVRALAVTSQKVSPAFPDLPPLAAEVPGYAIDIWVAVFAPAGTPAALIERLNREINELSASPDLRVFLDPDGAVPVALSSTAFATRIRDDLAQWRKIAAERRIRVD
jgi:tripartite-type tricarboxylate transporter receptor subunit TctC